MNKREILRMLYRRVMKLTEWVPDDLFLKIRYRVVMKEKLNLDNPVNFNEKTQWLKIHDRKEYYTQMVDKYAAKEFVAERIGEQYIVPTYGVWNSFEEINFSELPNQFVLKTTHDSASYVICRDKDEFDMQKAKQKMNIALKQKFYYHGREWPYKNVHPRIIAEKYMEDSVLHELRDYKLFTFNGVPRIMHIVSNRQTVNEETYGDFFDMQYNHLNLTMGHNQAPIQPEKPHNFELMKQFAEKLAEGTKFLRVDFYEVNQKLYFGELTFYQDSGCADVQPPEWNDVLGEWIKIY